jgi:hypothetical protein
MYVLAFLFFGIALGCKLQAVFILPFIALLYFSRKDFSLFNFVYTIIAFWALGIFAFVNGRSLLAPIGIYLYQIEEYPKMFFNFPSFWTLFKNDYFFFGNIAIITTAVILLFGMFFLNSRKDFENKFFVYVTWTVWTILLFLPKMHDRYAFLLDILLLLVCFQDKRLVKYALVSICLSLFTYGIYLGGLNNYSWERHQYIQMMMMFASIIYIISYYHFTSHFVFNREKSVNGKPLSQ